MKPSEPPAEQRKKRADAALATFGDPEPKWIAMIPTAIDGIIARLGGLSKASGYMGIARSTFSKWRLAGRIPSWAIKRYGELTEKKG